MKISLFNKLILFCAGLLALRFAITEHFSFLFLFWNLFLAWVPLFVIRRVKTADTVFRKHVLIFLSVLFLPNAPYILTDLFHLKKGLMAPLWLDLLLILSFAILGLIYFLLALEKILRATASIYGEKYLIIIKHLMIASTGYGIYLGRFLRFNSWDLVSNPIGLARGVFHSVFDSRANQETFGVTIAFSVFLYLVFEIYLSFKLKAIGNELSKEER